MRSKNTAMKLACILGGLAFLMAIGAYGVAISQGTVAIPSGGSGVAIPATFRWTWEVSNDRAHTITATANPGLCEFMEALPGPDVARSSDDPGPITRTIEAGKAWTAIYSESCNVMVSGSKYYWQWQEWTVSTSTGDSGTSSDGDAGVYNCH